MHRRLLVLAWLAAAGAFAQEALPKGEAILDKYIEATGGRAAYEKLHSEIVDGTFEMAGKGITAKMTIYRKPPNQSLMVIDIPGIGKLQEGVSGDVVWSNSAVQGPRIKEGEERALALVGAAFNADLRWREFYKSVETMGVEDVDGQPCYKVLLTMKDGPETTRFYDKKTGLLVKASMTVKTQMGAIPTESAVSDYRSEAGLLRPRKAVTKMLGQEIVMTFDNFRANAEIDPAQFDLPAEIKALLKK